MNQADKTRLWEQIAAIPAMERGKLSAHSSGRHQKLQRWQAGKNHTRHVPAAELPVLQSALAGYAQYQQLTDQYADLVIQETRQNLAAAKKSIPPAPGPSRAGRRNPAVDRPLRSRGVARPERRSTRSAGAHGGV